MTTSGTRLSTCLYKKFDFKYYYSPYYTLRSLGTWSATLSGKKVLISLQSLWLLPPAARHSGSSRQYGAQRQLSTRRFLSFWMVAKPLNNHKLVSSSLSNKLTESSITASNEIQPRQESILMTLTIHQSHFQDMRNTWASFSICLNRQKKNQSTVELNPHLFSPLLTQPVTRLAATLGAFLSIIDGLKSNKTPSI